MSPGCGRNGFGARAMNGLSIPRWQVTHRSNTARSGTTTWWSSIGTFRASRFRSGSFARPARSSEYSFWYPFHGTKTFSESPEATRNRRVTRLDARRSFFMPPPLMDRPTGGGPEELPVRPPEPGPDQGKDDEPGQEAGEDGDGAQARAVLPADDPQGVRHVEEREHGPRVEEGDDDLGGPGIPVAEPAEPDGERFHGDHRGQAEDGGPESALPAAGRRPEPVADPLGLPVQVGDEHEPEEGDHGEEHPARERGEGDDLLKPEEVPGSLGRVLRHQRVGHLLQRGVQEEGDRDGDRQREHEHGGLRGHQVGPGGERVLRPPP